jgi:hypothetical protein
MDAHAILITTTVDSEAAVLLATRLVERRQVACVQQIDIRSHYLARIGTTPVVKSRDYPRQRLEVHGR